jgi:hypothetical protein
MRDIFCNLLISKVAHAMNGFNPSVTNIPQADKPTASTTASRGAPSQKTGVIDDIMSEMARKLRERRVGRSHTINETKTTPCEVSYSVFNIIMSNLECHLS